MVTLAPETLGVRAPRIFYAPPGIVSFDGAKQALEVARAYGIRLDDWQELAVLLALAQREDGKFAAFETGDCVPRQNGKGGIIEVLKLAGVEVFGERLVVYSAHLFDTSSEAMLRMEEILETGGAQFKVTRAHGKEGFTFPTRQRIRYRTRTKSGGRGMTGDRVIIDEAMIYPEATHGALMPTMSAKSVEGNPQMNFFGSAVDQDIHEDGVVFARLRARARRGDDPRLAYAEWSAPVPVVDGAEATPDLLTGEQLAGRSWWQAANPALGIRISEEHVAIEHRGMGAREFAVERLGVGDWPAVDDEVQSVIDRARWSALEDADSSVDGAGWFAFDVSPSQTAASIVFCGRRADAVPHLEVVDSRRGASWLEDRLVALNEHRPVGFVCDEASPAAALVPELKKRGLKVETITAGEMAKACSSLLAAVEKDAVRHRASPEIAAAIRVAAKRKLNDRWAWSRGSSRGDITPLVAATEAHWKVVSGGPGRGKPFAMAW